MHKGSSSGSGSSDDVMALVDRPLGRPPPSWCAPADMLPSFQDGRRRRPRRPVDRPRVDHPLSWARTSRGRNFAERSPITIEDLDAVRGVVRDSLGHSFFGTRFEMGPRPSSGICRRWLARERPLPGGRGVPGLSGPRTSGGSRSIASRSSAKGSSGAPAGVSSISPCPSSTSSSPSVARCHHRPAKEVGEGLGRAPPIWAWVRNVDARPSGRHRAAASRG
jgi:hypothetical protein